jgi:RNA polymerase sigma factor (sigma-70 family)
MLAGEEQLIKGAQRGDKTCQEALFTTHVKEAVGLAYLITGDWALAEDAAQEAFIKAFKAINNLRDNAPFKPWFTKILVNQARKKRNKVTVQELLNLDDQMTASIDNLEQEMMDKEKRQYIYGAVCQLKDKYRMPILLKYYGSFSEAEISVSLKIPVSTVKSRLYAARQKLKDILLSHGGDIYEGF